MFGTAAAAQRIHVIMPGVPVNGHGGDTPGLLELLDGQFDTLAAASSTSNAALDHLAAAITKQYAEIKASLTNLSAATAATPAATATTPTSNRTAGTRTGSLPSDQRETEKRIIILQAAVKNKWKVRGFCSTHVHGVRAGHSRSNCNNKREGHVTAATRASPAGTGGNINKGWDDWLF